MRDPDSREALLYEIIDLRRRRDALRSVADDEALSYGARHIARIQASEVTRAIHVVRRIYRNLDDIERRRSEDYLRACYLETVS
jgi:predicted transcriptional regulator